VEKKKILIVDDDAAFLESSAAILEDKNFCVAKAKNAEAAFEALTVENPDIILLDINLPDKNGFEVLKIIKESKDFSKIPVILITGDLAVHIDRGFCSGADDCIFKPIDMDALVAMMNKLTAK